jgi:ABC-2 type transport system permease protein
MTSKAIKKKRDDRGIMAGNWQPIQEQAPSVVRGDEPTATRVIALFSIVLILMGGLAMLLKANNNTSLLAVVFGGLLGQLMSMVGVAGLLLHAYVEKEMQYRRLYGLLGLLLLAGGMVFRLLPVGGVMGGLFLTAGAPCLGLGLCFLIAFVRNEEEEKLKELMLRAVGGIAAILIVVGLYMGIVFAAGFLGSAFVHLILGMIFAGIYIGLQSVSSVQGYWAGIGIGVVGGVMILIAMLKIIWPDVPDRAEWLDFIRWQSGQPAAPFMFIYVGVEYLLLSILLCSDNQLVVLTRREVLSFLHSPVAYIVVAASVIFATIGCQDATARILQRSPMGGAWEPIVAGYIYSFFAFIPGIFSVPIITMRLLSEEKRSGTLEVLLTAPVDEINVVVSKFLAALRFYLVIWYPWALFLVALRVESGQEFDYRPVLSFVIALLVTGASFVSMGLFFSSLTRNQIASAMLTFAGMMLLIMVAILENTFPVGTTWNTVVNYVSFLNLWSLAIQGSFVPRFLLFHISLTIIFLFLTIKVLESRKWK